MNLRFLVLLIAVLSGIAGLGYQITWSRMFAIGLGHEIPSVLAVITAFFAGLALGGWWLDRRLAVSLHPARWYVAMEMVIAGWVLLTIFLIPFANQLCFALIGEEPSPARHWTIAFLIPLVTLLPATVAMGATLPAMDRFAAPLAPNRKVVGGLYGANTFGAVLGTIGSAYWINPSLGYTRSLTCFAALNLICAAVVAVMFWRLRRESDLPSTSPAGDVGPLAVPLEDKLSTGQIAWIAFATGLLGIGFEVVGIRMLNSVFANTIYSYAAILAVFLLGTAIGGMIYQRLVPKQSYRQTLAGALFLLTMSLILGAFLLSHAHGFYFFFRDNTRNLPLAELSVAILVFALPTILMGVTFSHLAQSARHDFGGVGKVLAVNTIGSSLSPVLFGIVLVPMIGVKWCLVLLPIGYLTLLPAVRWRGPGLILGVMGVAWLAWAAKPQTLLLKPGQTLVVEKPGRMTSVAVVANPNSKRGLRVSNHFVMGGTQRPQFERIQGLLPLIQHPNPHKVLFLGIGTGITLGAATADPQTHVTGVELVPEVVEVLPYFEPENNGPTYHPRVRLVVADARRFIRATKKKFDVVVGDLYHPGRDGAGSLYTVEHFASLSDLLTEDGLVCVWVPSYQTDHEVFKTIVRSYLEIFPAGVAYCGIFDNQLMAIALISDNRFAEAPVQSYQQREISRSLRSGLQTVDLQDEIGMLGHLVADNESLKQFAGIGVLNRDDWPIVTYQAPQYVYNRYPRPWERFQALNEVFANRREEFLSRLDLQRRDRLARYWEARDHYFKAMMLAHSDKTDELMLSLRASDEFPEAYREALIVAQSMQRDRLPKQAINWLEKVIATRPESPAAQEMLTKLRQSLEF